MTIGRNDPCHCGSGRKYKNCHLALDVDAEKADAMLEPFFGYHTEDEVGSEDPLCMVRVVDAAHVGDVNALGSAHFKVGDWVLLAGAHKNVSAHGPFDSPEAAFAFGRKALGAEHFTTGSLPF